MNDPIDKALWYIESKLRSELSLDEIAAAAGVSRFVLSRQFTFALGLPVIRYVRARRLSLAASELSDGAEDILGVAVAAGYASHEAFSRAFRDHFGVTPESARENGAGSLALTEPKRLRTQSGAVSEPRFEKAAPRLLSGLSVRYKQGGDAGIPLQWHQFGPYIGSIEHEVANVSYGVCTNFDDDGSFDYLACVEVKRFGDLPRGFSSLRIPSCNYAVFTLQGHVTAIPKALFEIWTDWLPRSGHQFADASFLERYDQRFDPIAGDGEIELWLALE